MRATRVTWIVLALCGGVALAGLSPGADAQLVQRRPAVKLLPPVLDDAPPPAIEQLLPAPPGAQKRWTLDELVALAAENHPELASAQARAAAARGKLVQVGLYPNPTVTVRSDEMNNPNGRAGFPALTVIQEVVTAHKLQLNRAAQAHGVAAADWQAMTRWYDVLTRLRVTYVDVLTAQLEVEAHQAIVKWGKEGLDVTEKLLKAQVGNQRDVLRARVELEQNKIRLEVARTRLDMARRQLALAVGLPHLTIGAVDGDLESPAPAYAWDAVAEAVLVRSSEVQEAQALHLQAEGLLRRARVEPIPNVLVQVRPIYSAPDRTAELMVDIGAAMPLFNRNQGNISAAQADVARTAADVRVIELKLTERLNLAYQRYQAADKSVVAYRGIVRDAFRSMELVKLGYDKNDPKSDYTAYLQSLIILNQAKVTQAQVLGDLWRSVSEVAGLLQEDRLEVAEPRRQQR
jgi:cobalt-zinc-cadmium efflux system outer membrane protein